MMRDVSSPSVLIADDNPDNRAMYELFFGQKGWRVVTADNGREAVAVCEAERPDVVVMDLGMPVMDGWEATRLIKSNPKTKHAIVIVLTGFDGYDGLQQVRAFGAHDVCMKPCVPSKLYELVTQHYAPRR